MSKSIPDFSTMNVTKTFEELAKQLTKLEAGFYVAVLSSIDDMLENNADSVIGVDIEGIAKMLETDADGVMGLLNRLENTYIDTSRDGYETYAKALSILAYRIDHGVLMDVAITAPSSGSIGFRP